ncbi:MAG: hypothetical protein U0232_03260 [Thermomicrobiales bacterium]
MATIAPRRPVPSPHRDRQIARWSGVPSNNCPASFLPPTPGAYLQGAERGRVLRQRATLALGCQERQHQHQRRLPGTCLPGYA